MNLYFDIETIQTQRQDIIDEIAKTVTAPGNIKKPESIAAWETEKKPAAVEQAVSQTVFDGGMGEVIAFSCALGDGAVVGSYRIESTTEAELLGAINSILERTLSIEHGGMIAPVWTGHYITGFDLRFLWKRFVINGIKPVVKIPYDAKPWGSEVFDTCMEWKGGGMDRGSMDFVCKALGIEGKTGMDGSMVYDYWKEGRYNEIADYCDDDVRRTRAIHKALTFSNKD